MEALIVSMIPAFDARNEADICNKLQEFNKENAQTFTFPELGSETKKKFIGDVLQSLEAAYNTECYCLCLEALRIMSREKHHLYQLAQKEGILLLLKLAGLEEKPNANQNDQVIVEAEKCLCNLVFNSTTVQQICVECDCVRFVMDRVKLYVTRDPQIPMEIKFFDMRLLFLMTALCPSTRSQVRNDHNGIELLTGILERDVLANATPVQHPPTEPSTNGTTDLGATGGATGGEETAVEGLIAAMNAVSTADTIKITEEEANLACEVYKALFNTVIHSKLKDIEQEEESGVLKRLGQACYKMLLTETTSLAKTEECHSQTINLLTCALPLSCVEELTPEPGFGSIARAGLVYRGRNMEAVSSIMRFLEMRVDRAAAAKKLRVVEQLNPVLSALCVLCRRSTHIRRLLKDTVLPPLKKDEACHLPEEGCRIRNKLVRLMTNHSTDIKEVVADFLFILCKESVTKLIKYTGYGNAAGMLARRGLLAGGHGNTDYSPDEEDSDTEEYKDVRNEVNPVTGRVESERPNPMEGMTDEQKEVAAVELANMIHRITREGVIQPMSVSDDGKLIPMMDIVQKAAMQPLREEASDDDDAIA
ncbi:synembryn-A-like [Asterias rubens]|uniref:synembryn-A-like n=1 Tax=Asterias rubens TaxID=7604 RepID=UPI001454F69A|nr:synembryn-A-like [Asterias rubens]